MGPSLVSRVWILWICRSKDRNDSACMKGAYVSSASTIYAPTLQSGTALPNHSHREDPAPAQEPRPAASHPGWSPVDLDASHAENRNLGVVGSSDLGRQERDRTHRHGPV